MTRRRIRLSLETLEDRNLLSATITDLGVLPGDTYSSATAINGSGQVVGWSESSSGVVHAFLYSNGQMTDLGTLPGGDTWSFASGINDSGQVVGDSGTSSRNVEHGFLYSNGQMIDLGTLPGDAASTANGINDSGQVVGSSGSDAFLYSSGQMTDLGTLPGGDTSIASGINSSGQVVGDSAYSNSDYYHAFVYSNGQMTDLGTLPGGDTSIASGINSSGQVVGDSYSSSDVHAFLYSNGQMIDLGTLPGDTSSNGNGINDSGQVVGWSDSSSGVGHAFLYSNGQMIDLNNLLPANSGWELTNATAINDSDQIVGTGTINGQQHAFLLNLGPAPSITSNPTNQPVAVGQTATFTASAIGTPTPMVQWQVSTDSGISWTSLSNGTNISGATTGTLTISNVTAAMNGYEFEAVFSNSAGNATTNAATLTVTAAASAPTITAQPSNQTLTAGQTATFTASAGGTPTPTVQWQVSPDGGQNWTDIASATSTTLTLANVSSAMNDDEYRAVFSNGAGTASTNAATLTVTSPPGGGGGGGTGGGGTGGGGGRVVLDVPPLLAFFDSLLGGVEVVNGNGTETITDSFFGIPLLVSTFDSSGHLESVLLFGINVTALFEML